MAHLQVFFITLLFPIIGICFEVTNGIIVSEEKVQLISKSQSWLRLMHYKVSAFGTYKSTIDGADFFFAPDGKVNPEAELRASLKAIYSPDMVGKIKMPFPCSFPERTRFLVKAFELKIELPFCEVLDRFMEQFHDPQSVSLVFSTAYPNNPASMFGHSFLKINSMRNADLIDVGINYAARVGENENGLAFIWLGVSGGYSSQWSSQPYYVKVREYINSESRDLWEYRLALDRSETVRLLHHIWELEMNSNTDYYFFDENCSYQVLAILEAIRPDWNLLKQKIYLIPGESIKFLVQNPGSVTEVKYRPSIFNQLQMKYLALSDEEKNLFQSVVDKEKAPTVTDSRLLAEALIAYYDFLKTDNPERFQSTYSQDLEDLRIHRSRLGLLTDVEKMRVPEAKATNRPDLGHDSFSLQVGGGTTSIGENVLSGYLGMKFKLAYHDLLNNDLGFSPYAHIDFPSIDLRYFDKNKKWIVEEVVGISTTSLSPVTQLKAPLSFRVMTSYRQFALKDAYDLHQFHSELGVGFSYYVLNEWHRFYSLLLTGIDLSDRLTKGYSGNLGAELGLLFNPFERFKIQASIRRTCDMVYSTSCEGKWEYQFNNSWHLGRNHELRNINKQKVNTEDRGVNTLESSLSYIYFFN